MSLVRSCKLFSSPLLQASKFLLSSSSHAPHHQSRALVGSLIPQVQGNVYSCVLLDNFFHQTFSKEK